MTRTRRTPLRRGLLFALVGLIIAGLLPAIGAARQDGVFVPIGGGYSADSLEGFAAVVIDHAYYTRDGVIDIAVVPSTYGTSLEDREENIELAGRRAQQVEDACEAMLGGSRFSSCESELLMLFDRSQAEDAQSSAPLLERGLDGVFILGGDQTIAMEVLAGTIAEQRMADAYARGVVFGGTSAGAAMQSQTMLGGYTSPGWPYNALERDKIIIWWGDNPGHERGLSFGLENVLTDQHFYERGRLTRLLNAVAQSDDHFGGESLLGIGVDWGTGVEVLGEDMVASTFGASSALVVDAETGNPTLEWLGPNQTLSADRILTHVLAPGNAAYDIQERVPLFNGQELHLNRRAYNVGNRLHAPTGGTLILGGDLSIDWTGAVMSEFIARAFQQRGSNITVLAAGYSDESAALAAAEEYANALRDNGWDGGNRTVSVVAYDAETTSADIFSPSNRRPNTAGVIVVGGDQALLSTDIANGLQEIVEDIVARSPVTLTDRAMTAYMGDWAVSNPDPTNSDYQDVSIESFRSDYATLTPGLGIINGVAFEPVLTWDQRWGRLYGISEQSPETLVYGISENTAILLESDTATVIGQRSVVGLDGRQATFETGSNGAFSALNVVLYLYAPGELIP